MSSYRGGSCGFAMRAPPFVKRSLCSRLGNAFSPGSSPVAEIFSLDK